MAKGSAAKTLHLEGIKLDYSHSRVDSGRLGHTAGKLSRRLGELRKVVASKDYNDDAASLLLPSEREFLAQSTKLSRGLDDATALVVVGIGGSNLGTSAVLQAVKGSQHNLLEPNRQVFFADTADAPSLHAVSQVLEAKLGKGEKVIVNAISKSGSTAETLANFRYFLGRFANYAKANPEHFVATTDSGSKFEALAEKKGFSILEIPQKVGGRYSVFSNVGLFPLAWAGVDAKELLAGAKAARDQSISTNGSLNPAAVLASLVHLQHRGGKTVHDSFLFSTDLEGVGKWYRQLMGESLGKEYNAKGTVRLRAGMTPTVSIGSTDLHSIGQLYFGGPRDKFFRVVSVARGNRELVPASREFDSLVPNLGGKSISQVMGAILEGTTDAMVKAGLPFVRLELKDSSERTVGSLLQLEMVEMMLLGELMNVNPFDQPAVEYYKKETRRVLFPQGK